MSKFKHSMVLLTVFCLVATGIGVVIIVDIDQQQLQNWLETQGIYAPIIYLVLYTIATLLILPSTPLNLMGGAIFGIWWGSLWTTLAAIIAAIIAFAFSRTVGKEYMRQKLGKRWQAVDAEISQGGLFYMFAIRLLPIIPYGIVNFSAGLTSLKFRDYFLGTLLGTLPGVLPFVMIGAGITQLSQGNLLTLTGGFTLSGILIGGATWYRRRRQNPQAALQQKCDRQKK